MSKTQNFSFMLKKIAHNSTIPASGRNHDLKALQNLIAAEKTVLISLQRLSVDYSKASEALRTWGLSEGDYLGGILSASTSILNHFSSALSQYAAHGHSMRDQLKAIRKKEESLDDLERHRRSILRKADDADKKLNKMAPESRYFTMQTDTLNRLRDDIQTLNSDIMSEEAALDKFKRSATRVWMGLKFGGLVECCEKGTIAGEFGKLAIAEISEELTQPGSPRNFTYPQDKIEDFVAEAYRNVNMVTFSTFPSAELRDRGQYDPTSSDITSATFYISAPTEYRESSNNRLSMSGELQPPPTSNNGSRRVSVELQPPQPLQTLTINDDNASYQANRPFGDGNGHSPQDSSFFQTLPSSQQLGVNEGDVDNIGANVRSTGPQYQQQLSQGTVNSSFFQTLPSSQQLVANEFRSNDTRYPQFPQGTVNPSFSQTLPPSQQRVDEGAIEDLGANVRSTSPPYQQQFSQGTYNHSFSQTLPPSHQIRVNENDFGANVRSTGPPYQQQFTQGTTNPTFSQTLPSSRQFRANEGAVDDFGVNTHSNGPPYHQQFSQGTSNSSLSQTLPPSQQIRVNEGPNVRATAPPYEQQSLPPSQQFRVNEVGMDGIGPNVRSPQPQQFSQGTASSSLSETLPPSQQIRTNDSDVDNFGPNVRHDFGANVRSTGPPYQQQFSQGTTNHSFSQTLPSSRQLGANEGAVDNFGVNSHSTGPPYQQFSQGTSNSPFSQTSQQIRNEGTLDNFSPNVRPTAPPYEQQFSQPLPPSQQIRVNEGTVDDIGPNVRSPHPQQFSQGIVNSSFSQTSPPPHPRQFSQEIVNSSFSQTLPPSQPLRVNEGAVGLHARSIGSPHPQQFSQGTASSSSQTLPPSQQNRVNEGGVDNFGPNVRSPHPQQFSQGTASSSFSQTLSPSQQIRTNEGTVNNFGSNVRPTTPPYPQQGRVNHLFSQTLPPSQQLQVNEYDFDANVRSTGLPHPQQFSQGTVNPSSSQTLSPYQQLRVNERAVDNSGSNVPSTGLADSSSSAGGRTATFQVQTRPTGSTGGSLQDPCSIGRPPKGDSSISASVANALHEEFDDPKSETKMTPWTTDQFNDIFESPFIAEGTTRRLYTQPANAVGGRSHSPLPVPAPPGLAHPWTNTVQEVSSRASVLSTLSQVSVYHDALMVPCEDSENGETTPKNTNEEDTRHVRFGDVTVEDIDPEIEKRVSLEKEQRAIGPSPRNSEANRTENNHDPPQQAKPTTSSVNVNNPFRSASRRIPPPNITPLELEALKKT